MRAFALLSIVLLAGCAASAQTNPVQATHGFAYVDATRIAAMPELRGFYAAYDRETASLQATQNVPRLSDTRPVAEHQAGVVRSGAREANAALDALRARTSQYSPRMPDAASIRSQIANNYGRESATVHAKAGQSAEQYRIELNREAQSALQSYRASLDARVNGAYAARAQQLREKEAELEIKLDRQDADQDLLLRVKLQNLKSPQVDRAALKAKLRALEAREDGLRRQLQARDAGTLAAYKSQVIAAATRDYATMAANLQHNVQANWQLRQRVSAAQMQAPEQVSFPAIAGLAFSDRWSQFGNGASRTGAAFTTSADDIARRFSAIGAMDTDARGSAANEIVALQRSRGSLGDELNRRAHAIGKALAEQRGLVLVDAPRPGAVDLTADVERQLHDELNP